MKRDASIFSNSNMLLYKLDGVSTRRFSANIVDFISAFVFYIEHYVLTYRKNSEITILKSSLNYTGSDVERYRLILCACAISIDSRKMWEGGFLSGELRTTL